MSDLGRVTWQDDTATVVFERWLDAANDAVWQAISTPDGLTSWLSPASVDLRVGGAVDLDFGEDGLAGGAIIELIPGAVLEFEWTFPGEPDSILRIELAAAKGGTRLTLRHRLLPSDQAVGYGAGWHAHLDQLSAAVIGETPGDWDARFLELLPQYSKTD